MALSREGQGLMYPLSPSPTPAPFRLHLKIRLLLFLPALAGFLSPSICNANVLISSCGIPYHPAVAPFPHLYVTFGLSRLSSGFPNPLPRSDTTKPPPFFSHTHQTPWLTMFIAKALAEGGLRKQ